MSESTDHRDVILARLGGNEKLLRRVVEKFTESVTGQMEVLTEAVAEKDKETLHRAIHRIKGSVSYFEAPGVVAAADRLEESVNGADIDASLDILERLRVSILQLQSDLHAMLP